MTQRDGPTPTDVNYTFSGAELEELRPFGEVKAREKGEILVSDSHRALAGG